MERVRIRMAELMEPVDRQLMMCDSRQDTLMLACAMMERATEILDAAITPAATDSILTASVSERLAKRAMRDEG